jgi:hypothetical protein
VERPALLIAKLNAVHAGGERAGNQITWNHFFFCPPISGIPRSHEKICARDRDDPVKMTRGFEERTPIGAATVSDHRSPENDAQKKRSCIFIPCCGPERGHEELR